HSLLHRPPRHTLFPYTTLFRSLSDELGHVLHGGDLGFAVQRLAALELGQPEAAALGVAELAEEARDRMQVVDRDVVADVDRVRAQQVAQERHLHGVGLDLVQDRLAQVARADAIIARVVEPVVAAQQVRQAGLAHARHAEERDGAVLPRPELRPAEFHLPMSRCARALPTTLLYSRRARLSGPGTAARASSSRAGRVRNAIMRRSDPTTSAA